MSSERRAWTDYAKSLTTPQRADTPRPKGKYHNVKVRVDGLTFDSLREAARYAELKLLLAAGVIRDLDVHPVFALQVLELTEATAPPWVIHTIGKYTADFRYVVSATGVVMVEDVKSPPTRTDAYQLRKRFVEAQYGIVITERE